MKFITTLLLLASPCALALNMQIGYPIPAGRMSLYGDATFNLKCATKEVEIVEASHPIFDKFIRDNVQVMCFKDTKNYHIEMKFVKGGLEQNMLARQPGRYNKKDNTVTYQ